MKTFLCRTPKLGLFFAVAFLALQAVPATAADSGSGTFVGKSYDRKPFSFTFKDAYAFRAEDPTYGPATVVILSELPMDKKAMTAALKKERDEMALKMDPYLAAYVRLEINQKGKIHGYKLYSRGSADGNPAGEGDAKVNTAKRVEGSFSHNYSGDKLDLRFATDLADIGPGAPVKMKSGL
jgi:hypothetical protein